MMSEIDWSKIKNFKPEDFQENPDRYADPNLLYTLQDYRNIVGKPIHPSPVPETLARFSGSGTSQHYVGDSENPVRKSTAADIFVEGIPFENYLYLLSIPKIKGIGIYLNTTGPDGKPWIMFHVDLREKGFSENISLLWFCEKVWNSTKKILINTYRYPQLDSQYWKLFKNELLYTSKTYGK